jgi:hypothetical protein
VENDLKVLGTTIAARVSDICVQSGVMSAFAVRRELINFKKVLQHLLKRSLYIEKHLRQQTAMLYCPILEKSAESEAYSSVSEKLMQCQGSVVFTTAF